MSVIGAGTRLARALVASTLVVTMLPVLSAGAAQPDPAAAAITVVQSAPSAVLSGASFPVSVTVSNPATIAADNLSLREVLGAGEAYVAGSTAPAAAGDPTVVANEPSAGQTTLLWSDVADLQAASPFTLTFNAAVVVKPTLGALPPGATTGVTSNAYVNRDPAAMPAFDATGAAVPTSYTGSASTSSVTTVALLAVADTTAAANGELLRGVHTHQTTSTITVSNNQVTATTGLRVDDWLPAGLEFLGCGQIDNTTTSSATNPAPGAIEEYPGSGPLTAGSLLAPAVCPRPVLVETVSTDPDGAGPLPPAVYTHVRWALPNLAPGAVAAIQYRVAIPLRDNAVSFAQAVPTAAGDGQAANLDNNSGPETADGQVLTNLVVASGISHGVSPASPAPAGRLTPISVSTTDSVTAKDLTVQDNVDQPGFEQARLVNWALHYQTSEYRSSASVILTDTLPNGLCPLGPVNYDAQADPECAPVGKVTPSTPYGSVTETALGAYTIVWPLGVLAPDTNSVLSFPAKDLTHYAAGAAGAGATGASGTGGGAGSGPGGGPTGPTVAGDTFTNGVVISGTTQVRCTAPSTTCAVPVPAGAAIAPGEPGSSPGWDQSSATQAAGPPTTQLSLSALPAPGATLNCSTTAYAQAAATYQVNDRICFRLRVQLPANLNARDVRVTDVLPVGTRYQAGSMGAVAGANTAAIASFDSAAPALTWVLGSPSTGVTDRYTSPGQVFEIDVSVVVTAVPAATGISRDVMKVTSINTAGITTSLLNSVSYTVGAPTPSPAAAIAVKGNPARESALVTPTTIPKATASAASAHASVFGGVTKAAVADPATTVPPTTVPDPTARNPFANPTPATAPPAAAAAPVAASPAKSETTLTPAKTTTTLPFTGSSPLAWLRVAAVIEAAGLLLLLASRRGRRRRGAGLSTTAPGERAETDLSATPTPTPIAASLATAAFAHPPAEAGGSGRPWLRLAGALQVVAFLLILSSRRGPDSL